jgi:hypothetical protein
MPTFTKGKSQYVAIGTAGTETNISTYLNDTSFGIEVASEDTTTFGVDWTESQPTLKTGQPVALEGFWNPTIHGILQPLLGVEGKSIIYGPEGNTTGQVKDSALGFLSKYEKKATPSGITTFSAEFTISGTVTTGTF